MDPNQTWKELAQAWDDEDDDMMEELAQNLFDWLIGGGFPPTVTGVESFDRAVARMVCDSILMNEL